MDTAFFNRQLTELLNESARGNQEAFRELYDETASYVFAIALKMLRDRALAEDVLQDVYVKVWHRASTYPADRGGVMTWLTSIVRYRAIDVLRKQRDDGPDSTQRTAAPLGDRDLLAAFAADDAEGGNESGPMASAMAADDSRFLRECIERLSASQAQSVSLAFFRGLTHHELSERLELPLGTIKSRLRRSLQRLKDCLGELGFGNEISTGTG